MLHDGHRKRLRRKAKNSALEDHELLELLLFYAIPRRNTNDIAHVLLQRFGSFQALVNADTAALCSVHGIGENAACLIKTVGEIMSRCEKNRADSRHLLSSFSELSRYLSSLFIGSSSEKTFLLLFNPSNRLIGCEKISDGIVTVTPLSIRKILDLSLQSNASSVLLAHNHPDGIVEPSEEDLCSTQKILQSLADIGVRLVDHYIVTPNSCLAILHPMQQIQESNV